MFLTLKEGVVGVPQNKINTRIKVIKDERRATQIYFLVDVYIIFCRHYILSDFITYLFVIFNIPKHNKKKLSNSKPQIFLSAPTFIFVYLADPTWLGTTMSHLSATACGWP
jgi:hypothetical protein